MRYGCVLFLLLTATGLQSCAADRQSRLLASQLRQLTAQYNATSTAKIEAERNFYLDSTKNLETTLNVVDPTKDPPDVTKTLAYGRIITATNAASLKLAGDLVDVTGSATARPKITAFIQDGIISEDVAFHAAREEQTQSAQAMATDFDAIEQEQATLSGLTQQLTELEKPTSFNATASQLAVIGQAVIQQLKNGQAQKK